MNTYNIRTLFKLLNTLALVVLLTAATTGCRKKTSAPQKVYLEANIMSPSELKASNGDWDISDRVGLYMKASGKELTEANDRWSHNNVQMRIYGRTLVSDPQLFYPLSGTVDFIAYYPYTSEPGYTIDVNVANQAAGTFMEPLYSCNATNQAPVDSPVTLNFISPLAKLAVTVTEVEGSAQMTGFDFAVMTVSIDGMYTGAMFQLTDGAFVEHQKKGVVTMRKTNNTLSSATFEASVLPFAGDAIFLFNVGGVILSYEIDLRYAGGYEYRFDFGLNTSNDAQQAVTMLNSAIIIPRAAVNLNRITF